MIAEFQAGNTTKNWRTIIYNIIEFITKDGQPGVQAILIGLVNNSDSDLLYLRMVGHEVAVNAIWAKLVAYDSRGKAWGSRVRVPTPENKHSESSGVACAKHVSYRTVQNRLPSGQVDLALLHPALTVSEDSTESFYCLTHGPEIPFGFFDRLNRQLQIAILPEWEAWLWEQGQKPCSFETEGTKRYWDDKTRKYTDKPIVKPVTVTPIDRLKSHGTVQCYRVYCGGLYEIAWWQIIRKQLGIGIQLEKMSESYYQNGIWQINRSKNDWLLFKEEKHLMTERSLDWLLVKARDMFGVELDRKETETNG